MSKTKIPESVKIRLWAKAAGRCQYAGCNTPLWLDSLTQAEFNTAYVAHIVADEPDGPRGDPVLSPKLAADMTNLMLMCDEHHRLIDKHDVVGHPADRLRAMKAEHENRIETVTEIAPEKRSYVLLYGANVGAQASPLSYAAAAQAMVPERYPAEKNAISLGMKNSSFEDRTDLFWTVEAHQLQSMITEQVRPRLRGGQIDHFSIFALAPQPLLILLGSLLSDIPAAEVYQLRREPRTWKLEDDTTFCEYTISEPQNTTDKPVLVFSLSATVTDDRIYAVLGKDVSIWRVSIPAPNNDFLKSKSQTEAFRKQLRPLMDRIKAKHNQNAILHVFPAMPVALAVEFGRILMPKADLPLIIYDQNKSRGGFIKALEINSHT